jgi:GxxExxY protein
MGSPVQRQVDPALVYDGTSLDYGYRADVIVNHAVILELQSADHILPLHEAQRLTCLRLSRRHTNSHWPRPPRPLP